MLCLFHRGYWHRLLPQNQAGWQMGSTLMRSAFGPPGAKKRTSELANAMMSPFALTPFTAVMLSRMFALSHDQLALVMTAAGSVPVEKRSTFLERVAARLQL